MSKGPFGGPRPLVELTVSTMVSSDATPLDENEVQRAFREESSKYDADITVKTASRGRQRIVWENPGDLVDYPVQTKLIDSIVSVAGGDERVHLESTLEVQG